nr:glycosyltransferase [Acuticoccus kalidii]
MYDGAWARPDAFFQQFVGCRFASFSRELHKRLLQLDCRSVCFEYWPEAGEAIDRPFARSTWSAFFWERRPREIPNARSVIQQCRALSIGKLHLHAAPDFADEGKGAHGYRFRDKVNGVSVSTSKWFDNAADYHAVSTTPLFYFAPRLTEGIGMATLEAMARGQIVVAPDRPTANQYIGHMSSGLLYDPDRPYALPMLGEAQVEDLSRAARLRVKRGREEWDLDRERLISFLTEDGRRWATTDISAHFGNKLRRAVRERRLNRRR